MRTTFNKTTLLLAIVAIATVGASALAAPAAQSMGKAEASEKPAPDPMANLKSFTGTWDAQVRSWASPGAEPQIDEGTSVNDMVLDDKYLQMRYKGSYMGQTFVGMGFDTYDPARDVYVSAWMDSFAPGVTTMEGKWDPDTKSWTYFGSGVDPQSGKSMDLKTVITVKSASMRTYQSWFKGPDGEWVRGMEIIFSRIK